MMGHDAIAFRGSGATTANAVASLLMRAEKLGVHVWVESGHLRYRGGEGVVPRDLLEELGANRASVLAHLSRADSAHGGSGDDLVPTFEHKHITTGRVRSFRQASWYALKEKLNLADSTNCRFVARVRGYLDLDALVFAFDELRQNHHVLRATVSEIAGQPWLVYGQSSDWQVERRDVSHLPAAKRESAARVLASEIVWRNMDVTSGPLFRAFVIALDREDYVLGFVVHHFITDTISMQMLSSDLIRHYSLKAAGHRSKPQTALQYGDYLLGATEWLAQASIQAKLREWADRFASARPMDLVHQEPRPPEADRACTRYSFDIDAAMTTALERTARQLRTSKFVILLTIQEMLLASWTGNDRVIMGAVVSGRELPMLTQVVGYFADRVHWITNLEGDPTFAEAVGRVNESYLQAMRYQFFRSDMIQEELVRRGKWLHAPVCNFMPYTRPRANAVNDRISWFDVEPAPCSTIPLPGISYWMALKESAQTISGDVRFPHGKPEELVKHFLRTLSMVTTDGMLKLSAVRQALRGL